MEKNSAWNLTKVRSKKEVIDEARTAGATVHFASLMDICHLKNAELEAKHQKYKGRVVLRGDIVKDNSGSYAVFTEQGSSASQMTAAKIMDIISRLPGFDGQAADAVSAYTQVKMEDAHKLSKIPKSECPGIWIRLQRHKWPKSWSSMEDPAVPLKRNLYGHPLAGLIGEKQFEKILLKHGWAKIPNWECLVVHHRKGLFLSVYVDDIKLAGKKHNIDPMWNVLNKEVDLGEPTSFLDHVYLGCTQRQCETSKDIVDDYRIMFESRISAGRVEKLPFPQNLRISSWSYDMAGHAKNCVERYCELANKTTQQLYKVSTPYIDDHHCKEEETKSVGELSNTCSQIVLKYLYLARIRRPDIREYTLHRYDPASQPKRMDSRKHENWACIGSHNQFSKLQIWNEIRIWSVGQDNSQSWVRISYGTVKYVIDSIENNTEIPADPHEDQMPQTSINVIAARSKAKAKPQKGNLLTHQVSYRCTKCVGCDIVQADHAPEAGVAQGIFHEILVRHHGEIQEEVEEGLGEEIERRVKREHSSSQTQVRMHG